MKNLYYLSVILLCILLLSGCSEETKNISPSEPIINVPDEFKHLPVIDINSFNVTTLPEKYSKAMVIPPSYISTSKRDIQQTYGPWGYPDIFNATTFNWTLPDNFDRISAIAFSPGGLFLNYFQVWYGDANDKTITYGPAGNSGGSFNMIPFSKDEVIMYIAGGTGTFVTQLTIVTNKRIITTGGNDTSFSACFSCNNQVGLGFYGGIFANIVIRRIGFYGY